MRLIIGVITHPCNFRSLRRNENEEHLTTVELLDEEELEIIEYIFVPLPFDFQEETPHFKRAKDIMSGTYQITEKQ